MKPLQLVAGCRVEVGNFTLTVEDKGLPIFYDHTVIVKFVELPWPVRIHEDEEVEVITD